MVQISKLKTKKKTKLKFVYSKQENVKKVELFGLNNDWDKGVSLKKRRDGSFFVEFELEPDKKHVFKYRINDKEWQNDCEVDEYVEDGFGGKNSIVYS